MMAMRGRMLLSGFLGLAAVWPHAVEASSQDRNITGLPAYPNLTRADMDKVLRTENLGRWCAKFTAETSDSLAAVEFWYRQALTGASETDLANDRQYNARPTLTGIKLALGIDYVAIFRTSGQPTSIELHRCSWTH